MPNHITNILEFDCSPERFQEIAEFLRANPDEPLGNVDFNKLIPMPESLAIESGSRGETGYKAYKEFEVMSMPLDDVAKAQLEQTYRDRFKDDPEIWTLGKQYYMNIMLYGTPTWYGWCNEHWNTKWNAYDCVEVLPGYCQLEFLTAWSSVPPIVEAISSKFEDVTITYKWADEDIGFNVGEVVLRGGEYIEDRTPVEGSKEAYELAADIMGGDPSEWGLSLSEDGSTYEWHDMDPEPDPVPAVDQKSHSGDAR